MSQGITWVDKQTTKWLRVCQLLVGKNGNGNVSPSSGIMIEGLRIQFDITKTIYRTPNVCTVKIHNLSGSHERAVLTQYNDVILQGGYQDDHGMFFRGNVVFGCAYRDDTHRICEVNVKDGDKDFNGALVNFTLAAGHTDEDAVHQLLTTFQATILGHVHGKNLRAKHKRARTFSGNARDVLDDIAGNNDAAWSIQDGTLVMVPVDSTLPSEAIVVSSETGLIGAPEVNDKGISLKVRFDRRIIPGCKIWLKNNEVKMKHLKAELTGQKRKLHGPKHPTRTDPDGIYKVYAVHSTGDNRGKPWESDVKCVALDSPIPSIKGMPQSTAPDGDIL